MYAEKKRQIETNKKEGEATSLFRVLSFLSFGTLNRRPLERPKKLFTCTLLVLVSSIPFHKHYEYQSRVYIKARVVELHHELYLVALD